MRAALALAAAAVLLSAAPASAALVTTTYTGTVSGTDDLNYFGGGALTDLAFTATFQYDTTLGVRTTTAFFDSLTTTTTSPYLLAELKIGDVTYSWDDVANDDASAGAGSYLGGYYANYVDNVTVDNTGPLSITRRRQISINAFFSPPPGSLDSFVDVSGDLGSSNASFEDITLLNEETMETSAIVTALIFRPNRLVVTADSAIPEPATWTLMITGFGFAGTALRRRQTAKSAIR